MSHIDQLIRSRASLNKLTKRQYKILAVGSSKYHINCLAAVLENERKIGVEFKIKDQNLYKKLELSLEKIQQELDCELDDVRWRGSSGVTKLYGDLDFRQDKWEQIYDWYLRWINDFAKVIPKYLK